MMKISFIFGCASLGAAVIFMFLMGCFLSIKKHKYAKKVRNFFSPIKLSIFILFTFLSLFCLMLSKQLFSLENFNDFDTIFGFFLKVISEIGITAQHFLGEIDFSEIFIEKDVFPDKWNLLYYIINGLYVVFSLMSIIAGLSIIANFIQDYIPKLHLKVNFRKKRYLFSALNESSLEIATKIFNDRRSNDYFIVFFNCEEVSKDMLYKAETIGAICLKENINNVEINCCRWVQKVWYFICYRFKHIFSKNAKKETLETFYWFIDGDVSLNNIDAIGLATNENQSSLLRKMDNITIFVSNHISNHDLKINEYYERTFDPKIFKKIKFAISNEWKNLVYNLIFDDETALYNYVTYDTYVDKNTGEDYVTDASLSVLIIGGGLVGKEFFKACTWVGKLAVDKWKRKDETYQSSYELIKLKINVMSKKTKPSTEELFKAEMPGLEFNDGDTEQKNKLRNSKNLFYDARFHQVEYGTKKFETTLKGIISDHKPTYILVALGDDDLNYQAATSIGKQILQTHEGVKDNKILINYFIDGNEYYTTFKDITKKDEDSISNKKKDSISNKKKEKIKQKYNIQSNFGENIVEVPFSNLRYNCISNMDLADKNYTFNTEYCFFFSENMYNLAYLVDDAYRKIVGSTKDHKRFMSSTDSVYQSISSVIHAKYKSYMLGILNDFQSLYSSSLDLENDDVNKIKVDFSKKVSQFRDKWSFMEHSKWVAYNYCEGYISAQNRHILNYIIPAQEELIEKDPESKAEITKYREGLIHLNLVDSNYSDYNVKEIVLFINKLMKKCYPSNNLYSAALQKEIQNAMSNRMSTEFAVWVREHIDIILRKIITNESLSFEQCKEKGCISLNIVERLDDLDLTNLVFEYAKGILDDEAVVRFKEKDLDFELIGKKYEK